MLIEVHSIVEVGKSPGPGQLTPLKFDSKGVVAELYIEKYFADLTYQLGRDPTLIQIQNEKKGEEVVNINASDYLHVFDILYPEYPDPDEDSMSCFLFKLGHATLQDFLQKFTGLITLPLLQQQRAFVETELGPVTAGFAKPSYTVTIAKGSIQIYISFTLTILVCCLILITPSFWI